jgi:hypothetical protein
MIYFTCGVDQIVCWIGQSYKVIFKELGNTALVLFQSILPTNFGAIAQLEERLICIQEVVGSIPSGSTILVRC